MSKHKSGFWGLIFASFFRWWWAVVTGVATLASYVAFPSSDGLHLSRTAVSLAVFIVCTVLFLATSAIWQSWLIYREHHRQLRVVQVRPCDDYEGEYVFVLEGNFCPPVGTCIELGRFVNGIEVPIALAEVIDENSKGQIQTRSVWFTAGHRNAYRRHEYLPTDVIAKTALTLRTIRKAMSTTEGQENPDA